MPIVQVKLAITSEEYARYYRGNAKQVICTARDGRTVQFPAAVLRSYLLHEGVYGEFEIEFSNSNKFIAIRKLNP